MQRNVSSTTRTVILAILAAVLILFGAIVWAQGNPDDPEGGRVSPIDRAGSNEDVELQTAPGAALPALAGEGPEGDAAPAPGPAVPGAADEVELQLDPDAAEEVVTLFKFTAGSSFHARESTTTYSYGGAGCTYRTSSNGFLVSDLQLPEGAEIDFVRLYYYDNNTEQDADLYLYEYDGQGGFTEIRHLAPTGSPGYSSVGSGFFSYVVNNTSASLGLVAGTGSANNNSVRICGVRLRYKIDVPSWVMLPAVLKQ